MVLKRTNPEFGGDEGHKEDSKTRKQKWGPRRQKSISVCGRH
eukprot:CAMPEP_0115034374 /NCGR_PEP_ID=MMETSP0216-20121206/40608_1 /TAXON_ID=223996 /ORGANISM="Protocruzia adherens, Strain Boccale" /LENGTH=41 /DNA_ID= /DNA_START= /DNA_END= /DNA_ORIENTATION=